MNFIPIIIFRIVIFTFEFIIKDLKLFNTSLLYVHLLYLKSPERNLRFYGISYRDRIRFNPFKKIIKVIVNKVDLQWPRAHQKIYFDNGLNAD